MRGYSGGLVRAGALAYDTKHGKRTYIHAQNHLVRGDETAGGHACAYLQAGDVIVLSGDLGAGKTQFVQGVAAGLGVRDQVTSPTFNILLTYPAGSLPLYHFDLYRLEEADELEDIGYYETSTATARRSSSGVRSSLRRFRTVIWRYPSGWTTRQPLRADPTLTATVHVGCCSCGRRIRNRG